MTADPTPTERLTTAEKVLATSGIVLHLAVGVFPYAASGLLAPLWGIAVLYAGWVALLVAAIQMIRGRRRVRFVALLPVAALVFWFAVLTFGDLALGWTA